MALFLQTFLKNYAELAEKDCRDELMDTLRYLVKIPEVEEIEVFKVGFSCSAIFLERFLIEHILMKNRLDSELQIYSICFIIIRSTIEKLKQHNL